MATKKRTYYGLAVKGDDGWYLSSITGMKPLSEKRLSQATNAGEQADVVRVQASTRNESSQLLAKEMQARNIHVPGAKGV